VNDYSRLGKGPAWEYRVHRALFLSGWYVRRNVDLRERVSGAPQVMAEIDLLGISFDASLTARQIIAECKDRKGSGQEADRVIWLLGLGQLLAIDTLMLAKPRIAPATVRFSRATGVALYEEASVNEVEGRLGGLRMAGSFDVDVARDLIAPALSREALSDNRLREAYDWIHNGSWTEPPIARVRRLPGYFRLVMEHAKGSTRHLLLIEGMLALLVCSLQVSGSLRRHSPGVARALGAEALASGAAPASALKEIAASADDYYRDVIERASEEQFGKRLMIASPRLAEHIANPPRWSDSFFSMSESLGSRPEAATDVLRFADLALFERFAGRDPSAAVAAFIRSDDTWLASSLALVAGFCSRVWGLADPFFDSLTLAPGDKSPDAARNPAPRVPTSEAPVAPPDPPDDSIETARQPSLLDPATGSSAPALGKDLRLPPAKS
jgi:hypothetical protein